MFVLPFALLLLCGCANTKNVTPVLNNISFTAELDYGDSEFIADAQLSQDALKLVVREPREIKDLTLNIDKNGAVAEFKGITYTPDIDSLPQGAVAQILYDVFNDISKNTKSAVCNEENCEINGRAGGYKYSFEFSPSGLPISLEIDDINLDVKFSSVTLLN